MPTTTGSQGITEPSQNPKFPNLPNIQHMHLQPFTNLRGFFGAQGAPGDPDDKLEAHYTHPKQANDFTFDNLTTDFVDMLILGGKGWTNRTGQAQIDIDEQLRLGNAACKVYTVGTPYCVATPTTVPAVLTIKYTATEGVDATINKRTNHIVIEVWSAGFDAKSLPEIEFSWMCIVPGGHYYEVL